jgi:hypothetical protein
MLFATSFEGGRSLNFKFDLGLNFQFIFSCINIANKPIIIKQLIMVMLFAFHHYSQSQQQQRHL